MSAKYPMLRRMKRLSCSTVSATLIEAMEHADEMENVLVLYDGKGEPSLSGMFTSENLDTKTVNYMIDCFKAWLWKNIASV